MQTNSLQIVKIIKTSNSIKKKAYNSVGGVEAVDSPVVVVELSVLVCTMVVLDVVVCG
jgi:hypothetical protein